MIQVYGIKNCDSVKKALKFFKTNSIDFELTDFKQTPIGSKKIAQWLQQSDIETLFNARSTSYRNLKLKELNLNSEQKAEWLAKENLLIKRPVIEFDGKVIVGYNEQKYIENFLRA